MKKITFLFILLITSLGFSQEILINGDFETGSAAPDWAGNGAGANVADDGTGSNFVNAAVVTGSAEVWQTNLQQVIALTEGETYELKLFFAERHIVQSNFRIDTNIELIGEPEQIAFAD